MNGKNFFSVLTMTLLLVGCGSPDDFEEWSSMEKAEEPRSQEFTLDRPLEEKIPFEMDVEIARSGYCARPFGCEFSLFVEGAVPDVHSDFDAIFDEAVTITHSSGSITTEACHLFDKKLQCQVYQEVRKGKLSIRILLGEISVSKDPKEEAEKIRGKVIDADVRFSLAPGAPQGGCCKHRGGLDAAWYPTGDNFRDCGNSNLNMDGEKDKIYEETGHMWWDSSCR